MYCLIYSHHHCEVPSPRPFRTQGLREVKQLAQACTACERQSRHSNSSVSQWVQPRTDHGRDQHPVCARETHVPSKDGSPHSWVGVAPWNTWQAPSLTELRWCHLTGADKAQGLGDSSPGGQRKDTSTLSLTFTSQHPSPQAQPSRLQALGHGG